MAQITTAGIDLAKKGLRASRYRRVRQRGAEAHGAARSAARGGRLPAALSDRPGGVLRCARVARQFQKFGHTVKLMAPKFVAPYRKSGKNDGNDAEAICEAVTRPSMRFVPVKSAEQQALLALHRVRKGFIVERTSTINRLRGLMTEFGVVLPLRSVTVRRQAAQALRRIGQLGKYARSAQQSNGRTSCDAPCAKSTFRVRCDVR
jgi:transposase